MKPDTRWHELKKAWNSRPAQERRTVMAGAAVLAPVLVYLVLWQPAHDAVVRLQKALPLMRLQDAQMKQEGAELDTLRQRAQIALLNSSAMKAAVEASATQFHLRSAIESLDGVEPNGVRVAFSSVSFAAWLDWMHSLQRDQHIRVETLSVVPLQTEGMVKISATLVNGAAQ